MNFSLQNSADRCTVVRQICCGQSFLTCSGLVLTFIYYLVLLMAASIMWAPFIPLWHSLVMGILGHDTASSLQTSTQASGAKNERHIFQSYDALYGVLGAGFTSRTDFK